MVQAQLAADNVIVVFNNATQADIRTAGVQNQISAKYYALVHVAQWLAINDAASLPDVEKVGRAAFAAHAVLNQLFPWRFAPHDAALAPFAAALSPAAAAAASSAGRALAAALTGYHLGDGLSDYVKFTPAPAGGPPGAYQFTPNQTFVLYPQLATTRPFVIVGTAPYDVASPLVLTSTEYTEQLQEVFTLGTKDAAGRTPYQNDTAYFWADGTTTSAIAGHFNTIGQRVLPASWPLDKVARTFAQANVAAFDASIAGWAVKYKYLFWRPITAIRQGDGVPSNAAYVKADWAPELATPPHPEFASGHQYSVSAMATVFAAALGTDRVTYSIGTEFPGLPPRTFDSLTAAVDDCGNSRVWGGVHFRESITVGNTLGKMVAEDVVAAWDKATWLPKAPVPVPVPVPVPCPKPAAKPSPKPAPKRRPPPPKKSPPKKKSPPPKKKTPSGRRRTL